MKTLIIALFLGFGLIASASAVETKKVCKMVVNKTTGKKVEQCKTIKVHKKLKGTRVPK